MSKKPRPIKPGRIAIEWLKEQHLDSKPFQGGRKIREALMAAHPGKFIRTTVGQCSEWERQARMELAVDKIHVMPPVWQNKHLRTSVPTKAQHKRAQVAKVSRQLTEARNLDLIFAAVTAQPYATAADHRISAMQHMVVATYEAMLAELLQTP
jgi:hypothetical protein